MATLSVALILPEIGPLSREADVVLSTAFVDGPYTWDVARTEEHLPDMREVVGASPTIPTKQLVSVGAYRML